MSIPRDILGKKAAEPLERTAQPDWTAPMLATLTDDHFSDPDWIYERKLDGERCLAFSKRGSVTLLSRNKRNLNDTYPELTEALESQSDTQWIVDGEIVAFDGDVTSFSRLQQRMKINDPDEARESGVAVFFYLFDLLHCDGEDCTALPLRDRKRILREVIDFKGKLRFTTHRNKDGEAFLDEACRKGWEGLIAKHAGSKYRHSRSRDWLKFKCVNRQEFVIAGYTDPEGSRTGFGAIVVAYHDDGDLVCAGKVGTGFDDDTLESLGDRMRSRARKSSPIDRGEEPAGDIHWITPELVAEVAFTEWTDDGRLRHPRFVGLRPDKPASKVVRERPHRTSS